MEVVKGWPFAAATVAAALAACGAFDATPETGAGPPDAASDRGSPNDGGTTLDACEGFALSRQGIGFGEVRADAASLPIHVVLGAGRAGPTSFMASTEAPFAVTPTGGSVEFGSVRDFEVTFAPEAATPYESKLEIRSDNGCVASAALTGSGTSGDYAVSPNPVSFGQIACQGAVPNQVVAISAGNVGSGLMWSASTSTPFSVPIGAGAIVPNGTTSFEVSTPPSATPQSFAAILTLSLGATETRLIPVDVEFVGATLSYTPSSLVFSMESETQVVTVTNEGNRSATLTFASTSGRYTFPQGNQLDVAAGGQADLTIEHTSNMDEPAVAKIVASSVGTPICAGSELDVSAP